MRSSQLQELIWASHLGPKKTHFIYSPPAARHLQRDPSSLSTGADPLVPLLSDSASSGGRVTEDNLKISPMTMYER